MSISIGNGLAQLRSSLKLLFTPALILLNLYKAAVLKNYFIDLPLVSSLVMFARYSRKLLLHSFVQIKQAVNTERSVNSCFS